ncbi:hypothetical protein [Solirubrum puertoriconensis]|uniref:Uncharacterized protein n=1 Tax=Solirubrum puertoriconensis TaxID=1751427 RepID=A0A9X0L3C5_SOLP1|nr:hypothetical protein [Solirubrum puertoriconensis]KUG06289.1 hypothetical protein ASU33_02710 [Solirubrum puertoriconensis]
MAEINIQRKKKAASPWLLILLALLLVGLCIWYLVSRDPGPEQTAPPTAPAPESTVTPGAPTHDSAAASAVAPTGDPSVGALASEGETEVEDEAVEPADFYAFVADDPASNNYARRGLTLLSGVLVDMADRTDLRDQAVAEKRNDLTSATNRVSSGGSLRPGFVAAAELMQEMQRRGYATVEREASTLVERANQLSGRTATPAEQQAMQEFFQQAANLLRVLEKPAQT